MWQAVVGLLQQTCSAPCREKVTEKDLTALRDLKKIFAPRSMVGA